MIAEKEGDDGGSALRSEAARIMGKAGGPARNRALTPEQRSEIAKKGAAKRWATKKKRKPRKTA
jgi:hypothetical protein